jgi:hypothetical protein
MTEVVEIPISDLKPFPHNPTTHSDDQIAILVASIQEYGFRGSITVDDTHTILAGHGRVEAAKLCGLDKLPCMIAEGLTAAQKQAYVIADNKIAQMAGLDVGILEMAIDNLIDDNFDIDLTGYKEWEIAQLLEDAKGGSGEGGGDEGNGSGGPVISITLVFDNEQQKEKWYAFQRILKQQYPDALTAAQRLVEHIESLAAAEDG